MFFVDICLASVALDVGSIRVVHRSAMPPKGSRKLVRKEEAPWLKTVNTNLFATLGKARKVLEDHDVMKADMKKGAVELH